MRVEVTKHRARTPRGWRWYLLRFRVWRERRRMTPVQRELLDEFARHQAHRLLFGPAHAPDCGRRDLHVAPTECAVD